MINHHLYKHYINFFIEFLKSISLLFFVARQRLRIEFLSNQTFFTYFQIQLLEVML